MDSICKSCEYLRICGRKIIGSEKTVMTGCSRYKERKPVTNADCIRAMSTEEIEKWFWWMRKEMLQYTDSRLFLHDWLRQEAEDGE